MDESFDELTVPDNWLELTCKRKIDEPVDSDISYVKHPRLCAPSPSENSSVLEISSTTENSSVLQISSGAETFEDTSINEPHLISNDEFDVSLEYNNNHDHSLPTDKNIRTVKFNGLSCAAEVIDYKIHQENDSSPNSENRLIKRCSEEGQTLESSMYDKDSRTHKQHCSTVNNEDTLAAGYNKIVKCDEPHCLESETVFNASISSREATSSPERNGLNKIVSVVRDANIVAEIVPNKGFNEIYKMLLEHRDKNNRLDIVTFELTNQCDDTTEGVSSAVDIFEEVQQIAHAIPSVSVNKIYTILENLPPSSSRVQDVIANLLSSGIPTNDSKSSAWPDLPSAEVNRAIAPNDPLLENDHLLGDMRIIAKMFPDKDRNEIYALLEANFNRANRLESVINELLQVDNSSLEETQPSQSIGTEYNREDTISSVVTGDTIGHNVQRMRNIFPDCDPNYLYEKLNEIKDTPNCTDILAAEMFEKRDYPKLQDLLEKEKEKERKNKAKNLTMIPKEFLQKFSEPVQTFANVTKEPSSIYKQHCEILLQNEFLMLKNGYLKKILGKHKGHLYPAYQEISALLLRTPLGKRRKKDMFMKIPRSLQQPMPDTIDEYFYHELWFVHNELSVLDYIEQKKEQRKLKIETARMTGELCECCCCYDDECLLEDLASCPEGHLFCKTCVVRSTEAAFGEMKTKFPCLTGECDQDIPLSYLQTIIPASLFSKIVRRLQEEEVQQANIPDLVVCPFCPFAAIMSNPEDKVFKCLSPDCLKESCRLCQEPNHIPLRCNEVEKKAATDMRVYIENKISEAVMRKCHKCGKRFVKETGCNKMTCICGATSCYVCRATDIDYGHFTNNDRCANTNHDTIHQLDMEAAAIMAKNQYLLDHPDAADIELKTDVKDMITDFKLTENAGTAQHVIFDEIEQDEDYEDDYDGDNYEHDDYNDSDDSDDAVYY